MFFAEVVAIPLDGDGAFGSFYTNNINGSDGDTSSGVTLRGVGKRQSATIQASGDPSLTGDCNGNAALANRLSAIIKDTDKNNLYTAKDNGSCSQIGSQVARYCPLGSRPTNLKDHIN